MHSIAELGTNVPAFLGKLWKMVEDPVTNDLISWSLDGKSFVIKDEIHFARELLPMYYKHNNMASFIRQLNMYGFHKIVSTEAGAMKLETPDEIQFSHPFFIRGHSYLLDSIKRKIAVNKALPGQFGDKSSPQVLGKVLTDVRQMKGRQESIDSKLTAMKLENGALWRELSVLRQKHTKQQQMVNKLIQFLVTLVHQNPNLFSMKRKYPRMLQHRDKMGKHHQSDTDDNASNATNSPSGPIIHELDPAEALLETVVEEVETEPVSPSQVTDYFLNDEEIEDDDAEMPFIGSEDNSAETIIGMPEDTLVINANKSKQRNSGNKAQNIFYIPREINKEQQMLRPKYNVKIVTSTANNGADLNQRIHKTQQIVIKNQQQTKQDLQYQIQMNQRQIHRNQAQIDRTQELEKNQQQVLKNQEKALKNRQEVLKNRQEIANNQQQILNSRQQLVINNKEQFQKDQHRLLQRSRQQSRRNQQRQKNKQIEINLEYSGKGQPRKNQQQQLHKSMFKQLPKIAHTPLQNSEQQQLQGCQEQDFLLNKPQQEMQPECDNGSEETVIGEGVVGPSGELHLFSEGETPDFTLPEVVEVPPLVPLQEQQQSSPLVSQDLLLGSPLVEYDHFLTPRSNSTTTPGTSLPSPSSLKMKVSSPSPSSLNMQVACLEEPHVTSPNLITRSGHFSNEMGNHVDTMQSDLENLKELLRSEGISLDANALLSCFNEDPLSYNISDPVPPDDTLRPRENNGNELMAYNPTLLDLTDLLGSEWSLPASPSEPQPADDSFGEIHTPQFVPESPMFPIPAKRRKK